MKLRTKLLISFISFWIITSIFSLFIFKVFRESQQNLSQTLKITFPMLQTLSKIRVSSQRLVSLVDLIEHAYSHKHPSHPNLQLKQKGSQIAYELNQISKHFLHYEQIANLAPEEYPMHTELQALTQIAREESIQLLELSKREPRAIFRQRIARLKSVGHRIEELIDLSLALGENRIKDLEKTATAELFNLSNFLLVALCALLFVSMLMSIIYSILIIRPIQRLHSEIERLQANSLKTILPTTGRDEIGDLSRAFSNLTKRLSSSLVSKDYITNIINSLNDGLIVCDDIGVITFTNPVVCTLLHIPLSELLGQNIQSIIELQAPLKNTVSEITVEHNGSKHYLLVARTELHKNETDKPDTLIVIRDITQIRQSQLTIDLIPKKWRVQYG